MPTVAFLTFGPIDHGFWAMPPISRSTLPVLREVVPLNCTQLATPWLQFLCSRIHRRSVRDTCMGVGLATAGSQSPGRPAFHTKLAWM